MAKYREVGADHNGNELPDGVSGMVRTDSGMYTGYRIRWREEDGDGIERQPSKSFSGKKHGSLDQALTAATAFLAGARNAVKVDSSVPRTDPGYEVEFDYGTPDNDSEQAVDSEQAMT